MAREPVDGTKLAGAGAAGAIGLVAILARFSDDCAQVGVATARMGGEVGALDDVARVGAHVDDLGLGGRAVDAADGLLTAWDLADPLISIVDLMVFPDSDGPTEAALLTAPPSRSTSEVAAACPGPCLVVAEGFDLGDRWRPDPGERDARAFVARVGASLPPEARAAWGVK